MRSDGMNTGLRGGKKGYVKDKPFKATLRKRKVYIAGPMRGIAEYNYPAFMWAAKLLRALDFEVFNPAEMDIKVDDIDYTKRSLEEQKRYDTASQTRRFARRDLDVILSFKAEDDDLMVTLQGWENSRGATAETAVARWVGLSVIPMGVLIERGTAP